MVCCIQRCSFHHQGCCKVLAVSFILWSFSKHTSKEREDFAFPVLSPWGTSCVGKKILLLLSDGQDIRILSGDFPDNSG